jgi:hypothetical protein
MTIPNLFLIGAPKCGTTAVAYYISEHPDVFFSNPKELNYFCTDLDEKLRPYKNLKKYLRIFQNVHNQKVVAEGTTYYLMSETAIENILSFNAHAKFVAFVRNPIDMVVSYHRQQLNNLQEDVENFETAWKLQFPRAHGYKIPSICYDPKILQYGSVSSLGRQIEKLFDRVPEDRRHVIIFDDLKLNPSLIYINLLEFLEIDHDGRTEFPIVNQAYSYAFPFANKLLRYQPPLITPLATFFRKTNNDQPLGLYRWVQDLLDRHTRRNKPNDPISQELRYEMKEYFYNDVRLLSELTGRDLSTTWDFNK